MFFFLSLDHEFTYKDTWHETREYITLNTKLMWLLNLKTLASNWSPPPLGWLKINFGDAVCPNKVFLVGLLLFARIMSKIIHAWIGFVRIIWVKLLTYGLDLMFMVTHFGLRLKLDFLLFPMHYLLA